MELEDVYHLIEKARDEAGGGSALARAWNITPQYVTDLLHRRRTPGEAVLKHLGLRQVVRYESYAQNR
jgi:hypothetical protein